jgi:hypothetical protein
VDQCCTCVAVRCSRATAFFILDLAAMAETSNFGLCMAMATIMHRNAERATAYCVRRRARLHASESNTDVATRGKKTMAVQL